MFNAIRTISIGRLLLALAVSVFLWAYVQFNVIQEVTATYNNIPLKVIYPSEQSNYIVLNQQTTIPGTINVDVSGTSDAVHNLIPTNINATLDLSSYTNDFNGSVKVMVSLKDKVDGVNQLTADPETIPVQIEQKITKTLPVQVVTSGTPPNYISIGQIQLDTTQVTITGPESQVAQVMTATVPVDVANYSSTTSFQRKIVLLDKNNQTVTSNDLTASPDSVKVTVPVQSEFDSKTVPIEVTTKGNPFAGYTVGSIDYSPRIITVYGPPSILANVKAVQTAPVDISGASTTLTATTTLQLPGGVTTPNTQDTSLQVSIDFVPLESQKLVFVPLEAQNLGDGYSIDPAYIPITVTLTAPADILQEVSANDVHASVDLSGKNAGHYSNLPVTLQVPSIGISTSLASPSSVSLTVIPPATPTPRPTATPTPVPLPTYTPTPFFIPHTATPTASPSPTIGPSTTPTGTPGGKTAATTTPVPTTPSVVIAPSSSAIERDLPNATTPISSSVPITPTVTPATTPSPPSVTPTVSSAIITNSLLLTPTVMLTTNTLSAGTTSIPATVQTVAPTVSTVILTALPLTPPRTVLFKASDRRYHII